MFNAIVAVIALILMIGAAVAGLTYLGSRFNNGRGLTELAEYSSQSEQIQGTVAAYITDHGGAAAGTNSTEAANNLISGGYLTSFPPGPWLIEEYYVYRVLSGPAQCSYLNAASNLSMTDAGIVSYGGCPPCTDASYAQYPACQRPMPTDQGADPYVSP